MALWVGVGTMLATLGRVRFDVRLDPTSHNLWPFEVFFSFGIGLVAGLFGVRLATRKNVVTR